MAVHVNYRSRARQRGRIPEQPSYFLKPPSSRGVDGGDVVRPRGCDLLVCEGELAAVVGKRSRDIRPEEGEAAIGWYTAANDFGVRDLRWADRGSNLLSKGHDGFTPMGPRYVPAAQLDPTGLRLRTYVNGEVAQDDTTADTIFTVGRLVADLSRFMTLEVGDVILTGTPAGARPVQPGDVVEVEIEGIGRLCSHIRDASADLMPYGAMPRTGSEEQAQANGSSPLAAHQPLSERAARALREVSTATLTVQLRRHGISDTFLAGLRPTRPDLRMLGHARTLRYVPAREDVQKATQASSELNAQKRTIESLGPGDVLVIGARDELLGGTIGDILALRALRRGAAGIVTDGAMRDTPAVGRLELPAYHRAAHAAVLRLRHHPLESDVPIACAGVLVMPGDVLVGDAEGVVVIPQALAEEVADDALEQERREAWAYERIAAGESIHETYPIAPERLAEYEAWRGRRDAAGEEERL